MFDRDDLTSEATKHPRSKQLGSRIESIVFFFCYNISECWEDITATIGGNNGVTSWTCMKGTNHIDEIFTDLQNCQELCELNMECNYILHTVMDKCLTYKACDELREADVDGQTYKYTCDALGKFT